MQEYREIARQRFLETQKNMMEEQEKKLKIQKEEEEKKMRIENDHAYIFKQLEEWDSLVENYDNEYTLHILSSMINKDCIFLQLLKKYDRLDELQERMVRFVNILNDMCEKQKKSLDEIRQIHFIMKTMIENTEVDIPIEMMDTNGDEEMARKFQEQECNLPPLLEDDISDMSSDDEKKEEDRNNLPIVSFSNNREGLRLIEMKELAKSNGIGGVYKLGKHELGMLLKEKGLVRIV